jgi:hypothetical protein
MKTLLVFVIGLSLTMAHADAVFATGDFNDWQPNATVMQHAPNRSSAGSLELCHGHHHYLFVVDGEPTLVPSASGLTRNHCNSSPSLMPVS